MTTKEVIEAVKRHLTDALAASHPTCGVNNNDSGSGTIWVSKPNELQQLIVICNFYIYDSNKVHGTSNLFPSTAVPPIDVCIDDPDMLSKITRFARRHAHGSVHGESPLEELDYE